MPVILKTSHRSGSTASLAVRLIGLNTSCGCSLPAKKKSTMPEMAAKFIGPVRKVYKLKFDLQPGSLTVQVAGEHQP